MLAIIDYGVGNLFSLSASLKAIGESPVITGDYDLIKQADKLILPGVGAFADAFEKLKALSLIDVIKSRANAGVPILGICLGMQLLFERSFEFGNHTGLGLIKGDIVSLRNAVPDSYKVPHMGWNSIDIKFGSPILKYTKSGNYFYYVHSFYLPGDNKAVMASSEYGTEVGGVIADNNIFGTQFHPEKSGKAGLQLLKAFSEM